MKRIASLVIAVLCISALPIDALAQKSDDPVVIEVGGSQIRQSEFMKEFNNNYGNQIQKGRFTTQTDKQKALTEYADLYATFRAKLLDAHEKGFDTAKRLRRELARYRSDLAAPYLIDSSELKRILAEAYERNHYSIHAAHILITIPPSCTDEDTIEYYNTAMELYNRIVKDGEDFNDVATSYRLKHNPGAQPRPNEGDLGYFTVFDMVYPFENAAYGLKVGEVSRPVRTRYGYHIIKVLDRVEGLFGKVTMSHIWLSSPDSMHRASDINMIYKQLEDGAEFAHLARQSDDKSTSNSGGLLSDASLSQLPPEYIHQLAKMKDGEISKPFYTRYGWHIIMLQQHDTLAPFDEMKAIYKQRMARDQRGNASRKAFAKTCIEKYNIIDYTKTPKASTTTKKKKSTKTPPLMMASLDELVKNIPDSVFRGKWVITPSDFTDTTRLVSTPSKSYTSLDVAKYISTHQTKGIHENMGVFVRRYFNDFIDSVSIDYADSQLENEYPEFANIVNEYRRGLIIFNYNDAMIWRKAQEDSIGFAEFFDRESKKKSLTDPTDSIFFFNTRARVSIFEITNSNALSSSKALKIITKAHKKNMSSSEIRQLLLNKIDHRKYSDENIVKLGTELVEQGRQQILNKDQWQVGIYQEPYKKGYRILVVDEILPRTLKGRNEARGYYLNAWQNEVEQRLTEELNAKYKVKIYNNVLSKISF